MQIKFQTKNKMVAIEKGKTVGYLTFDYPHDASGKRNINLNFVYVSPKYRRKGLATKMINLFIAKFKNKVVWMSCWTGINSEKDASWSLYKKLGFKEVVYTKDYYENGVGTRLFVKRFKK